MQGAKTCTIYSIPDMGQAGTEWWVSRSRFWPHPEGAKNCTIIQCYVRVLVNSYYIYAHTRVYTL